MMLGDATETPLGKHSILIDCEQGSHEWFVARNGIPTASRFKDIVTSKGEPTKSDARKRYLYEIVGERVTNTLADHYASAAMERGTRLEPKARQWFRLWSGDDVQEVGFVVHDLRGWGCSPDGLIGDVSGIEIKCPLRPTFIKYALGGKVPAEYIVQIQGNMWVCERETWTFVMYTDEEGLKPVVAVVEKDEKLHKAFAEHLPAFCAEIDEAAHKLVYTTWGEE